MNIVKRCLRSSMKTQDIIAELEKSGERQFSSNSIIILWIQNTPNAYKTVLSRNGTQISSDTSKYEKLFKILTSQSLDKYSVLTASLKRFNFCNRKHRITFFLVILNKRINPTEESVIVRLSLMQKIKMKNVHCWFKSLTYMNVLYLKRIK